MAILSDEILAENLQYHEKGHPKGSPLYVPPEVYNDSTFSCRSDIFGCGVMLHFFLTGEFPFKSPKEIWEKRPLLVERLQNEYGLTLDCIDLLQNM